MIKHQLSKAMILLLLCNSLLIPSNAQDFEVAPAKMNFNCEPGQIQTKTLTIRNHANQKQQFSLTTGDVIVDSLGHNTIPKENTKIERSSKDWISISPSFIDINPNESVEVKVVMQVPPDHRETRWCMLYVTATEEQTSMAADKQMKSGIAVKPRISIKVLQSPASNTNYKASIENLKEITQAKDSVRTFQAKISNTGDKLIEGKIYLVLSNLETAKEIKKAPERITVLPGSKKMATIAMPSNIPPGKYSLALILDYGNNSALEAVQMNVEIK